jgi:hypothetical protein
MEEESSAIQELLLPQEQTNIIDLENPPQQLEY